MNMAEYENAWIEYNGHFLYQNDLLIWQISDGLSYMTDRAFSEYMCIWYDLSCPSI